jgi:superoxide dismutase, Fe-Mn family
MNITLTAPITFDFASLEPVLSREAVRDHHTHHYVAACADAAASVKGTALEPLSVDSLIRLTPCLSGYEHLFRRACQIRNHSLYWQSLHPGGGSTAWGPVADAIRDRFGTFGNFLQSARRQAAKLPGSGWLWVVWHKGRIEVGTTEGDAILPPGSGTVLLTLDLWEHAYYPDFRGCRDDYVAACLEKLVNWDVANLRLRSALLQRRRARQDMTEADTIQLVERRFLSTIPTINSINANNLIRNA